VKVVAVLLASAAATFVAWACHPFPVSRRAPTYATSAPLHGVSTLATIVSTGLSTTLVTRTDRQQPERITLKGKDAVLTQDGHILQVGSLRPGDQLVSRPDGRIEDVSQVQTAISGVVSTAPEPGGGSLIVLIGGSRDIVVDLNRGTQIVDEKNANISPLALEETDLVQVHGVLDRALGEMTQTERVQRVWPGA